MNSRRIEDGVVWFLGNDTTRVLLEDAISRTKLKVGDYIINAWGEGYMPVTTKKLKIRKDMPIEITLYLGIRVDF